MLILYDIMLSILIYCPVILQETERLRHKRRMTLVTLQVKYDGKASFISPKDIHAI